MAIVKISDLPLVDSPVEGTDLFVVVQDNVTKKAYASDIQTYVGFEEVQTATAGQTVFNLTQITYAAGANNLMVFVDGVNQYEGSSYVETDNNTVTFTQGLHVGAVVKFSTVQTQTSLVNSAGAVTFLQAGTGAVPRSVQSKERDIVSVKDFGAQGDGITDDTAAFAAAIAASKQIYIPEGTYIVDTIELLDVNGYVIEGASNTGAILKGKSTSSRVLDVRGSSPGGLNTYNVFKNFCIDTSAMNTVTPGAAVGIRLINTWGNSFYDIRQLNVSAAQRPLLIEQHVYTTVFTNCEFGSVVGTIEINGFFPSVTYSTTTLTFIGCSFGRCLIDYASCVTFLQPIVQGDLNKFQLNNVSSVTIMGGDIEGSATYLAFGTGCYNVVSINNAIIGFTGTYKTGTLLSGYLLDQTNDPYYFISSNGITTTAQMNGVVDEITDLPTLTRKNIRNDNAAAQTVDVNFNNATGDVFVGVNSSGDTYIDSRTSSPKITLQQTGVDRLGLDDSGQLILDTTTAVTAGSLVGYITFTKGVNTYKIPYYAA